MRISPAPAPAAAVAASARRAVFIDKDGTLVEDVPYNVDPALLRFTPHASEGLWRLAEAGFLLIVISNQPGLAMGRFDLPALCGLERALTARLALEGVRLDGVYACPHAPVADGVSAGGTVLRTSRPAAVGMRDGASPAPVFRPSAALGDVPKQVRGCRCRKPAPGLLLEAARDHSIDLARSWMVGDILDDVEAGWRAGCRSVHLDVGNETVWQRSPIRMPTHTAPNLLGAAAAILASAQPLPPAATGRSRRVTPASAGAR